LLFFKVLRIERTASPLLAGALPLKSFCY
jgi:hypothetical protein